MRSRLIAASVASLLAAPALAQQTEPPGARPAAPHVIVSIADVPASEAEAASAAPGAQALDTAALADLHARQGVTATALSSQLLQAVNSGNSVQADRIRSGDISIMSNAFAGFGGVGTFVMNTGNNNNLQGAVTINIVTTAPTP